MRRRAAGLGGELKLTLEAICDILTDFAGRRRSFGLVFWAKLVGSR
jgi:hypothetical protein